MSPPPDDRDRIIRQSDDGLNVFIALNTLRIRIHREWAKPRRKRFLFRVRMRREGVMTNEQRRRAVVQGHADRRA